MVDHFHEQVVPKKEIGGAARVMVVTNGVERAIQHFHRICYLHGALGLSRMASSPLIRQLFDEPSAALEARGVRGHVYLIASGAMTPATAETARPRTSTCVSMKPRTRSSPRRKPSASATGSTRAGSTSERRSSCRAATTSALRPSTTAPACSSPGAPRPSKVFAGRPDLEDIKHLAGILDITRTSDAIRICERAYPGWLVMERTRRNVGDAIADESRRRWDGQHVHRATPSGSWLAKDLRHLVAV